MFSYFGSYIYGENNDAHVVSLKKRMQQDLGDDFKVDEFCTELKKSKAVIAGSYPLQVYHSKTWAGSDIDIFATDIETLLPLLEKYYGKAVSIRKKEPYSQSKERYADFTKCNVYDFMAPKIKVQLVHILELPNSTDIIERFDFDFCKIYFDGEKMYLNKSVKTMTCQYDESRHINKVTYHRMTKYEGRGFKITNREGIIQSLIKYLSDKVSILNSKQKKADIDF